MQLSNMQVCVPIQSESNFILKISFAIGKKLRCPFLAAMCISPGIRACMPYINWPNMDCMPALYSLSIQSDPKPC
uniref:Uncharacterized protein n=1 Tax=Arundo donax TaxID=35708 RepID=A0A0A9CM32_ARUDO